MKYWTFKAVWLPLFIILLYGCASQMSIENRGNNWLARPLSDLKQEMQRPDSYASKIGWKETTYPLANGDFVYVEPLSSDCAIHWRVSQSNIIVSYQGKGDGCKEGEGSDYNIINTKMRNY